jgi:hypothetical protein
MHERAMWPIHGRYMCPDCLREYRIEWEEPRPQMEAVEYVRAVRVNEAATEAAR